MKYLYTISLCLIFTFFIGVNITSAQTCGGASCPSPKVCVSVDGATKCLDNQANSSGICTGDSSIKCGSNQACVSNKDKELVCAPKVGLTPAAINSTGSKTKCPTCPQSQQCIKKADGFLECRVTATDCTPACTGTKVCIKATTNATKGTCVDDAPAAAKVQAKPTAGGANTPSGNTPAGTGDSSSASATNNPNSLKDGLQAFESANSGLNTSGTLIGYVANIIRWILGILGTVFFVIIVLQGYLYMIAGGDSGKTASAVGAIGNAVVGLLIIMGAFLITNFVTSGLINSGGGTTSQSPTNTTNNRR